LIGKNKLGRQIGSESDEVEFRRYAAVLDRHLAGKSFLVGDRLTIADFSVAHMLMYAEAGRIPLADFPEIVRWFSMIEQRPGWIRSATPPF